MGWLMQFPTFRLLEFEASSGEQRTKMAQELDTICRDTGFLLLDDHGVPEHVIAAQWEVVARFFACPVTEKQKVAAPYAGYPYGWLGPNQEALAASKGEKTPPDLKESFNGGPLSIPENIADTRAYEFCYQPTHSGLILRGFKRLGVDITKRWKISQNALWRPLAKLWDWLAPILIRSFHSQFQRFALFIIQLPLKERRWVNKERVLIQIMGRSRFCCPRADVQDYRYLIRGNGSMFQHLRGVL